MIFLLDTDIVSALRRPFLERNRAVAAWAGSTEDTGRFISVMTFGEIERGIAKQRAKDTMHVADLERWKDELLVAFANSILPVTLEIARCWGEMVQAHRRNDTDLLIAATARVHGLTVVTRNVAHFMPLGVPVLNPVDP